MKKKTNERTGNVVLMQLHGRLVLESRATSRTQSVCFSRSSSYSDLQLALWKARILTMLSYMMRFTPGRRWA